MIIAIAAIIPAALSAQNSSAAPANLTAREIFYSPHPAPATAVKSSTSARKRPAQSPAPKSAETEREATVASVGSHTTVPSGQQAKIINAADHPGKALGLRYTLMKVSGGSAQPVGIHSVFHSGDRIKLNLEVNDPAYLYVVSRGSSGTWSPLFPSKDVDDGSNRVEPGRTYDIPPGHVIAFREPSGSERLFIVVSREPEPSLEKLIYSMNKSGSGGTGGSPQPATGDATKVLMASAHIGEDTVGGLRAYSRDLIVEDANEAASNGSDAAAAGEKSVYVVNPTGSADSRVVAEITLNHH